MAVTKSLVVVIDSLEEEDFFLEILVVSTVEVSQNAFYARPDSEVEL